MIPRHFQITVALVLLAILISGVVIIHMTHKEEAMTLQAAEAAPVAPSLEAGRSISNYCWPTMKIRPCAGVQRMSFCRQTAICGPVKRCVPCWRNICKCLLRIRWRKAQT